MAGNTQDISLIFGVSGGGSVSGESGVLIQGQLEKLTRSLNTQDRIKERGLIFSLDKDTTKKSFDDDLNTIVKSLSTKANSGNRLIKLGLDTTGTKNALGDGLEKILEKLSNQKNFALKINTIDASAAIQSVRTQLQAMLTGLGITGLGAFLAGGTNNTNGNTPNKSPLQPLTPQQAAVQNAAIKQLDIAMKSLNTSYTAMIKGAGFDVMSQEALQLKASYSNILQEVELLKTGHKAMTVSEIEDLETLTVLTAQYINDIKKMNAKPAPTPVSITDIPKDNLATLKQIISLYDQVDKYIKGNPKIFGTKTYQDLVAMRTELNNLKNGVGELNKKQLDELQTQFKQAASEMRTAGKEGKSLGDIISAAYAKFGGWALVTRSFATLLRSMRQMVVNVKEIDSAMTELKKVTNETAETYEKFLTNAETRAKLAGATLKDVVSASADFARLGYNLEDSATLADVALVYKNVGDGIADVGEASASVISTLKAFGIEAQNAMTIVDKFNKTGNNFAISSGGVGDALMRSAASLASAGNDLDQSIALVTAANEVIQNPETVGTTLKTVSMYLRAAKTEADEAGESTDGMAKSVSELRDGLLSLTGGRLDIQIDNDNFKSTYQILKELSVVWEDLSDLSRANIIEMVGGKRNGNVVSALLNDFSTAEEVVKTISDSTGSALAENEKYLDSIAGKLARFSAAFQGLSTSVIDSEGFKQIIEVGTKFIEILDGIVSKWGALPSLIGLVSAGLATQNIGMVKLGDNADKTGKRLVAPWEAVGLKVEKNKKLLEDYRVGMLKVDAELTSANVTSAMSGAPLVSKDDPKYLTRKEEVWNNTIANGSELLRHRVKVIDDATEAVGNYKKGIISTTAEEIALAAGSKIAAIGVQVLNVALNTLVSMFISVAIGAIVKAFDALIVTHEEHKEKLQELRSEYDSLLSEIDQLKDKIADIDEQISAINNDPLRLTREKDLQNLKDESAELKFQLETARHLAELRGAEGGREAVETYKGIKTVVEGGGADGAGEPIRPTFGGVKISRVDPVDYARNLMQEQEQGEAEIKRLIEYISSLKPGSDKYNSAIKELDAAKRANVRRSSALEGVLSEIQVVADGLTGNTTEERNLSKRIRELFDEFNVFAERNTVAEVDTSPAASARSQYIQSIKNEIADLEQRIKDGETVSTALDRLRDFLSNVETGSSVTDTNTALEDTSKLMSTLATAEAEMNNTGGLTIETQKAVLDAMGDIDGILYVENGLVKLNTAAWRENADAKNTSSRRALEDQITALNAESDILRQQMEEFRVFANSETFRGMTEPEQNKHAGGAGVALQQMRDAISANEAQAKLYREEIERLDAALNGLRLDSYTNSLKSAESSYQAVVKAIEEVNSTGEMTSDSLSLFINTGIIEHLDKVNGRYVVAAGALEGYRLKVVASTQAELESIIQADKLAIATGNIATASVFAKTAIANMGIAIGALSAQFTAAEVDAVGYAFGLLRIKAAAAEEAEDAAQAAQAAFDALMKNSSGGGSGSAAKEIEEYISELKSLTQAEKNLMVIEDRLSLMQNRIDLAYSESTYIGLLKEELELYGKQQEALHTVNEERRAQIDANSQKLKSAGFDVSYDRNNNILTVNNLEHINNLTGKNTEATNELRKEYENLIEETENLNKANEEASNKWYDVAKAIDQVSRDMVSKMRGIYENFIKYADDFNLWDNVDDTSKLDQWQQELAMVHSLWGTLITDADEYKDIVNELALNIYKEQKQSIEDIIQLTMKLIKQESEDQIEALEEQLKLLNDIIDAKKKQLEQERDQEDYDRELAKRLAEIAKLQSRSDVLSLDDSREAAAQRAAIDEELAQKQNELAAWQADHNYDEAQAALDRIKEANENHTKDEVDEIKDRVSKDAELYRLAVQRIDNEWETLYESLYGYLYEFGTGQKDELDKMATQWEQTTDAVRRYGDVLSSLQKIEVENALSNSDGTNRGADGTSNTAQVSGLVSRMKANSAAWLNAGESARKTLEAENLQLAAQISALIGQRIVKDNQSGTWHIGSTSGSLLYDHYHTGGIAGNDPSLKQKEMLAVLEKGEAILDERKQDGLYKIVDMADELSKRFGTVLTNASLSGLSGSAMGVMPKLAAGALNDNGALDRLNTVNNSLAPTITVNVAYTGNGRESDARKLGDIVSDKVMDKLYSAFSQRGVPAISGYTARA